jgi:hypothetical protein
MRYRGVWKEDGEYINVDLKQKKQNWFMDKIYYIEDSCIDIIDVISDFLIS